MAKKAKNKVAKNKGVKKAVEGLSRGQKIALLIGTWVVVFIPIMFVYGMLWSIGEDELPSIYQLENPRSDEASLVYDAKGELLGTYYVSNRTKVAYQQLSPYLIDALVATEDERFFEHSGVDGWALMRAVGGAMTLQNKGGGSTITQQLAKMMFHDPPGSTFGRIRQKFGEWIIAGQLEKRYTKKEIIAMYFNEFDFLHTAVGVHSAARVYFNKNSADLEIQEAAMLVGMFKNPGIYNPLNDSTTAVTRRNVVLKQMQKNDMLTNEQYDSLVKLPLVTDYHPETHVTGLAPYFREMVKQEAQAILNVVGAQNTYGEPVNIYTDGLKIYTTLDADMQKHAEWAVEKHLSSELQALLDEDVEDNKNYPFSNQIASLDAANYLMNEVKKSDRYKHLAARGWTESKILENFNTKTTLKVFDWHTKGHSKTVEMTPMDSVKYHMKILRAGLVSIDPHTGFIKAYVGGPDYEWFKYDYARNSKRQVGSTIKPFVYAAGIESGVITPCTEVPMIEYCVEMPDGKMWCPSGNNFDGTMTPMYWGLASSNNPVTTYVIKKTGGNNARVVKYLKAMGMNNSTVEEVPSLGLGICDQSVLDMTAAHAVLSNHGFHNKPIAILRIEDASGKVLYEANVEPNQVMEPEVAFDVLKMMKGVTGVQRPADGKWGGTAMRIRSSKYDYQFNGTMAGKTGTTQGNTDGWFIGHTSDLVTGVWVGCDHRAVRFSSTKYGQGANTGLPIWGYYMSKVYKDSKIKISHGDFEPVHPGEPTVIECAVDSSEVDPFDTWPSF
ncbi:transglycosylase domain-containing protein [Parvicella tangerina]|uniref:Penicillin-binding protein 1A n=1 Tax=Parvicella tangerina TaxID=2829795 RepID=A0A916JJA8_9FLAO|nr:transglycosylase domain-containing protein [Parvicella tangerina]CAG5077187.1 Penicillin-binding protein 1A [Parvicella tangerina]